MLNFALKIKGVVGRVAHAKSSDPATPQKFETCTWWIIEKSDVFSDVGLLKISESVRAYAYLILSSQASARSGIVGNTTTALTAQSAFLNNFENVVNHRVDIREDIKHYQDTLSYASSKHGTEYLHVTQ